MQIAQGNEESTCNNFTQKSRHLEGWTSISLSAPQVTLFDSYWVYGQLQSPLFYLCCFKVVPLPSFTYAVEFLNTVVGHYVYSFYILYFESQFFSQCFEILLDSNSVIHGFMIEFLVFCHWEISLACILHTLIQ